MIRPLPRKKLIEFGWDVPSPAYLRDNLAAMEARCPFFDGVMIRLPAEAGGGNVFDVKQWAGSTGEAREREIKTFAALPPARRFTDNFLTLYGASTMDWFSDADWEAVLDNVRYVASAAKAGRCQGVCWDAEPYGGINPWRLGEQPGSDTRTFADYERQVRERGAQFMGALQQAFPGLTVFALRLLSDFQDGSPFSQPLFNVRDPRKQVAVLENAWWGLHPAFLNGMLDAAAPDVTIIDGNEDAYYYTAALDYYRAYHDLRQPALALVAPENTRKYAAQYRVGHALAVDYVVGRWAELKGFPDERRKQALELTEDERARWFEHNTYQALATADEYVWCYSERMNWWTGDDIPPGIERAISSARSKVEAGEPLGFVVEPMLGEARAKARARWSSPS